MADILIRGFEMPKDRSLWLLIRPDGTVYKIKDNDKLGVPKEGAAISLPEGHGRLIDADAFKAMCLSATKDAKPDFIRNEDWLKSCAITVSFCRDIDDQPTIVPAEGENADGNP